MNKLIILTLTLLLMNSCGETSENEIESEADVQNIDKSELIKEADYLDGFWLIDNYLSNIEKTKSIYHNRDYGTLLYGFVLQKDNLITDSPYLYGFTDHEGGYDAPLIFNYKKNKFENDLSRTKKFDSFQQPFVLMPVNDSLIDIVYTQTKQKEAYRKVVDIQTELRRILFEGKYVLTHSDEKVSFNRNGKLTGFQDKIYFELVADFGLGIQYDAIILFDDNKKSNWSDGDLYKFEFVSDTIKFYHVETEWENLNHEVGGLVYELVRE